MLGIQLHVLLIGTRKVHRMDTKLELVIFESISASGDPVL